MANTYQRGKIVITGGPCSGKTSLVEALGALGYATIPEAAIQVIAELNRDLGLEGQAQWRQTHQGEFQERILARQVEQEEGSPEGLSFIDRGRLDGIAYCRVHATPVPESLGRSCAILPYSRVFLLDTLASFELRSGSGRTSDRAKSLRIREALLQIYTERGLPPTLLPDLPVPERVERVLAALNLSEAAHPPPAL